MTYVMSDLHGQYEAYRKMLELIHFSDGDELYILGDVIDRGAHPVKLLLDMSMRYNIYPILGNHEVMAAHILRRLCVEITEENYATQIDGEMLRALALWQMDGGQATLDEFRGLSPEERESLLEYLDEFTPYEELCVNGLRFLLVHGGVPTDKLALPMEEQDVRELVTERIDITKRYFEDRILVTGHTPTVMLDEAQRGRIIQKNGHIAIDCGAGSDIALGCLRLDDLMEFYVEL